MQEGSLAEHISDGRIYKEGPKSALKHILDVGIQLAWGLDYAHNKGIVHLDVKPANVMMDKDGTVKLTDFGLARARAFTDLTLRSKDADPGVSYGGMTPAYCSPEQAKGIGLSPKTDIWSWGLSVLEMFVGARTWMTGQAAPLALTQCLEHQEGQAHEHPRVLIPKSVAEVLRSCFREEPAARPANLAIVARRLQDAYFEATGAFFPREEPAAVRMEDDLLQVANLNNRAITMIELDNSQDAFQLLREAEFKAKGADVGEPKAGLQDIAYNLCLLQVKTNPLFQAENVANLVPRNPDSVKHSFLVGTLLLEGGEFFSSIEYLGHAVREDCGFRIDALNTRGVALLLAGQTKPAVLSLRLARKLAPERRDIARNLAWALYQDGRIVSALRLFRSVSAQGAMDPEDSIRFATILSASGRLDAAREWIGYALASPLRSSDVLLTASEVLLGAQTFLPGVVPANGDGQDPESLITEVVRNEPLNLRAAIDRAYFPSRAGAGPRVRVAGGEFIKPETTEASALWSYLGLALEGLRKRALWGNVSSQSHRLQCMSLAAIAALLAAWFVFGAFVDEDSLRKIFGAQGTKAKLISSAIFIAAILAIVVRPRPTNLLWINALIIGAGIPLVLYLPTLAHLLYQAGMEKSSLRILGEPHARYLWNIFLSLGTVIVVREAVFRWLIRRTQAYCAGVTGLSLTPAKSNFRYVDSEVSWASDFFNYVLRLPSRVWPLLAIQARSAYHGFGLWQALLAPQFFMMAFVDTLWLRGAPLKEFATYYLLMLGAHVVLLAYGAIVPRFLLLFNFGLALLVSGRFCFEFFQEIAVIPLVSFAILASLFIWLNRLAMQRCPAFARTKKTIDLEPWDIRGTIDPLNIRRFTAPWRIIEPKAAQGTPPVTA